MSPRTTDRILFWLEQLRRDIRFSLRSLAKSPGYSLTVLFTLILGIGVATVIFEITDWILFRDQPFPRPAELYSIGYKDKQGTESYYQAGLFLKAYQEQTDAFSEIIAGSPQMANVVVRGDPDPQLVLAVSPGFFSNLGIVIARGRPFLPAEYKEGAGDVVVISDLFWHGRFAGDKEILGKSVKIDQTTCTIVGVLAPGQAVPPNFYSGIFRPLIYKLNPADVFNPGLTMLARLKPGVTKAVAVSQISAVKLPQIPQWASAYFADEKPILTGIVDASRPEIFWVLFAAAAFLFGIACLNVANLVLIRLLGRRHEISIRFAVGASRWRVVLLLAVESLLLSLSSVLTILAAARWLFPAIFNFLYGTTDYWFNNYWDWRTIACIGCLGVFASLVTALVPALRIMRADINSGLKDGAPNMAEGRRGGKARNVLVVVQAAFAVILLTGTGLMVRSFERLHSLDLGFDPVGKVKAWVIFPPGYNPPNEARLQLFERLRERMVTLPGVKAASYGQDTLFMGAFYGTAQLQMADGSFRPVAGNFVPADYADTAGLTMVRGRWLSGKRGQTEVVINQELAKQRFGDKDPIGQFIKIQVAIGTPFQVVGVVRDVRETTRAPAGMHLYSPDWMYPPNIDTLILRMDKDPPAAFAGTVRRAIYQIDPRLIISDVASINENVERTMGQENFAFKVMKGLAVIALGLTIVGLFSVIAFAVSSRMTEFGIRMAVGATPKNIRSLIFGRGILFAAVGVAIGVSGGVALTRFMQGMLFETSPFDPAVYVCVTILLLTSATAACAVPARRAARADVIRLLKSS